MQAIPSPRPTKPMPSLRGRLDAHRRAEHLGRGCAPSRPGAAPSRGASQITVASTLATGPSSIPTTVRSRSSESASRQRLVVGREVGAEVAEPGGAEQRVDHRVGDHVGVGVALEPELVLDLDPAEHQPPARRRSGGCRSRSRPSSERLHAGARGPRTRRSPRRPSRASSRPRARSRGRRPRARGRRRRARTTAPGVDAHLGERVGRDRARRPACASPAVETSTAIPVSAIASIAGS